ncbi:hypothetical protein [Fulvivirga lutimaris]|uniref:hypothetical protein n=1 Tax=Fulvivirga lutimaris TaxID=1819566 RepID=UPI0012BC6CF1|nr:hypothetical protein [Fulvivirga lutimaris]MTI40546.1 hypothetical protein [Fulvivirga lutimaris]
MKEQIKEIKPGFGLGNIKFGMSRDQVRMLLGMPDENEKFSYTDDDQNMTESWDYYDFDISLNFDEEEDWKLVMISANSDFYTLDGASLIGQTIEQVSAYLDKLNIEYYVEDCSTIDSPDHKLIEVESLSVNFWFNGGVLDEIQWSPQFLDDDTIKWP